MCLGCSRFAFLPMALLNLLISFRFIQIYFNSLYLCAMNCNKEINKQYFKRTGFPYQDVSILLWLSETSLSQFFALVPIFAQPKTGGKPPRKHLLHWPFLGKYH